MTDATPLTATIRRPGLLVRAARLGLPHYDRARHLRRLFPDRAVPEPPHAAALLLDREAALDAQRREGASGYRVERHLDVLIALIAEARSAA